MKSLFRGLAVILMTLIITPWFALAEGEEATTSSGGLEYDDGSTDGISIPYDAASASTDYGDFEACTFASSSVKAYVYTEDTEIDQDLNEETALVEAMTGQFEEAYAASIEDLSKETDVCGNTPNDVTGRLELSDCAAEGKVVTEITETFGGNTTLGDEARVMTVYKGSCCMVIEERKVSDTETVYECKESLDMYYADSAECPVGSSCQRRQWIIGESGASIIKVYIKQIYLWAAGTIGFISVVIIVLNGIRISVSGVSGDITQAKERIIQSISGLVLLFLSGLILYTINPTFFS